jgi:hypothetical protein
MLFTKICCTSQRDALFIAVEIRDDLALEEPPVMHRKLRGAVLIILIATINRALLRSIM